jgi:hypothetical protein
MRELVLYVYSKNCSCGGPKVLCRCNGRKLSPNPLAYFQSMEAAREYIDLLEIPRKWYGFELCEVRERRDGVYHESIKNEGTL